jgi:hypothetical protein
MDRYHFVIIMCQHCAHYKATKWTLGQVFSCQILIDPTMPRLEGVEPPFGTIYNLLQDELSAFLKYIDEKFEKGFTQHSKFQLMPQSYLSRRRMDPSELPWAKLTHHQELIFATFDFGIIGSTQSC